MKKRYKYTKLHRLNMSLAQMGKVLSKSTKRKISLSVSKALLGRKFTKSHRDNIRLALLGRKLSKSHILSKRKAWSKLSYQGIHARIKKIYGRADRCENKTCNYRNTKRFEWCNLSGEYKQSRKDWIRLCVSCHRKYDKDTIDLIL